MEIDRTVARISRRISQANTDLYRSGARRRLSVLESYRRGMDVGMIKREDIIRMAQESGLYGAKPRTPGADSFIVRRLERFAALIEASVIERSNKSTNQEYGCNCDLEPGIKPDGCVLDEGRPQDCVYARILMRKNEGKDEC